MSSSNSMPQNRYHSNSGAEVVPNIHAQSLTHQGRDWLTQLQPWNSVFQCFGDTIITSIQMNYSLNLQSTTFFHRIQMLTGIRIWKFRKHPTCLKPISSTTNINDMTTPPFSYIQSTFPSPSPLPPDPWKSSLSSPLKCLQYKFLCQGPSNFTVRHWILA